MKLSQDCPILECVKLNLENKMISLFSLFWSYQLGHKLWFPSQTSIIIIFIALLSYFLSKTFCMYSPLSLYVWLDFLGPLSLYSRSMTGRARGRSRGRARSTQAESAPRPGAPPSREEAPQVSAAPQVARGRGRAPTQATVAAAPVQQPTSELSGLGEQVSAMSIGSTGEQRPRREREDSILKVGRDSAKGGFGKKMRLRANFFKVLEKSSFQGFFQYMVSYDPPIESKRLKFILLKQHAEVLGSVRAFDGMILFLPKKLPELETKLMSTLKKEETSVEITIKLTNEVPFNSPTTMQILNVIFRRFVVLSFHLMYFQYVHWKNMSFVLATYLFAELFENLLRNIPWMLLIHRDRW